ncbi:hypothetical protein MHU86_7584 [Fragilaria crotonensis]|nr:hypothetical protein MHU86_7584 [Fragilaria crotonensis]
MDAGGASQLQQRNYLHQLGSGAMPGVTIESDMNVSQGRARRIKTEDVDGEYANSPDTVAAHLRLLGSDSVDGNRLRAFYRLSVDELYVLPPIPSDEEYCARHNFSVSLLPGSHEHALNAARFAEIALGAVVHNEIALAMELCNATVHSLRECMKDPVKPEYAFEVARAYFLLGVFRAFRGDMMRYFKYRRASMLHLSKLRIPCQNPQQGKSQTEIEYGLCCGASAIASDPKNQMWIQGAPPVYLNNEAPLNARSLDAVACAIRSCCDQANNRFSMIAQAANPEDAAENQLVLVTPTSTAVLAHENELCSRNMVLSAYTLLQQHEARTATTTQHNQGHHMIISAIDAFLDEGDEDGSGGFTDGQVQVYSVFATPRLRIHCCFTTVGQLTTCPCVAAERAKKAKSMKESEYARETDAMMDGNDLDRALLDLRVSSTLTMTRLSMLSSIIAA